MATRIERIEALAAKQVGYTENPAGSNRTKYGAAYGFDGVPWCAMYQWWLAFKTGGAEWVKTAYTPTFAQWFIDQKRWSEKPSRGAIPFYNFPDSLDRIQHVGLTLKVQSNGILSNEGNTSSGNGGSQDNGGTVANRLRLYGEYIVGYGYPSYVDMPGKAGKPKVRVDLRRGDAGADVRTWQRDLNKARTVVPAGKAWDVVDVTGIFGPETVAATRALERAFKLGIDGRVSVHDILLTERRLRKAG